MTLYQKLKSWLRCISTSIVKISKNSLRTASQDGRSLPISATRRSADGVHVRTSSAAAEPHHLHAAATQRAGVVVPEDTLPWRVPEGGGGAEDQSVWGQSASRFNIASLYRETLQQRSSNLCGRI